MSGSALWTAIVSALALLLLLLAWNAFRDHAPAASRRPMNVDNDVETPAAVLPPPKAAPAPVRRRSHRGLWLSLVVLLLMLLAVAGAALYSAPRLLAARTDLAAGAADLTNTQAAFQPATFLTAAGSDHAILPSLLAARDSFRRARNELRPLAPILIHVGWLPRIGPQVAAADPAARAAYLSSDAAVRLLQTVSALDRAATARTKGTLSVRLAPVVRTHAGDLIRAQIDLSRAGGAIRGIPVRTGNAQLDRATALLRTALPAARQGSDWLAALPALLGVGKSNRMLLAWQDWEELRATGGFIAAADYVTVTNGHMTQRFSSSALPREVKVPPPLPEALLTSEPYWLFRDSNWSPDFRLSGRLERWFYWKDTGRWADGVIDFSNGAEQAILQAIGPVYLPQYGRTVTAGNVNALTETYVMGSYHGPQTSGGDTARKQFIGDVTAAILSRIQTLPPAKWPALGQAMVRAIGQGSILLFDGRPAVARAIDASNAGGPILRTRGDYLYIVDDNRSYNRINPYVRESAIYQVKPADGTARPEASLIIRYHLNPSPASIEGYGALYGAAGNKHDYRDFLRVYVPEGSTLVTAKGLQVWATQTAYGHTQLAGVVNVAEGRTATVMLRYYLPRRATSGRYQLTIQRQPEGNLRWVHVEFGPGTIRYRSRWTTLRTGTDWVHVGRPRHKSQQAEPVSVLTTDPYTPYHALRGWRAASR